MLQSGHPLLQTAWSRTGLSYSFRADLFKAMEPKFSCMHNSPYIIRACLSMCLCLAMYSHFRKHLDIFKLELKLLTFLQIYLKLINPERYVFSEYLQFFVKVPMAAITDSILLVLTSFAHLDLGGLSPSSRQILTSFVILGETCLWTATSRPLWGCFTGFKFEPLKDI